MAFSLAPFIGDGTELNPFRPDVAGPYAVIDLRADSTQQAGWCLLTAVTVPSGALNLGETLVENIPRGVSRNLETRLGVTLDQFSTLQAIIAELLILHGEDLPRGVRTRWRPVKPDHRGMNRIILGGETVFEAPAPVGATIADDFNRATLGANWTAVAGNWSIVSNEISANGGGTFPIALRYDGATLDTDNHYTQILWSTGSGNGFVGSIVRFNASAKTFYGGVMRVNGTERWIDKVVTGSWTQLTSDAGGGEPPRTNRLEVDGSALTLYDGGVEAVSTTDTDITGNVRVGVNGHSTVTATGDNFEAGDLGAAFDPANLSASVLGSDVTLTWDV